MQAEIDSAHTAKKVRLLGVNEQGLDAYNPGMTAGRVLPWLQDTPAKNVWGLWQVTYRDVVVLGADNSKLSVFNLTVHDLHDTTNYGTLKRILINAAK